MGVKLHSGNGITQDLEKAIYYLSKAAEKIELNTFEIMYAIKAGLFLGSIYYSGNGVLQNYEQAAYWYSKVAYSGNLEDEAIDARVALGELYYYGYGVEQNYEKATFWFDKGTRRSPKADYYYGVCLLKGLGVNQDINKAIRYLERSSNAGYSLASELLREVNKTARQ